MARISAQELAKLVPCSLENIRRRSPILADLEQKKAIQIVGGMYDLTTGIVEFVTEG